MKKFQKIITYADLYWGRKFLETNYLSKKVVNGGADVFWSKDKHVSHNDQTNVISKKISFKPRSKP